jgi:hypothetical protein
MRSYKSETPSRKPAKSGNIESDNHVFKSNVACFLSHGKNFMHDRRSRPLFPLRKSGKKLTNNFIILCELRAAMRFTPSLKVEAADAGGEDWFLPWTGYPTTNLNWALPMTTTA